MALAPAVPVPVGAGHGSPGTYLIAFLLGQPVWPSPVLPASPEARGARCRQVDVGFVVGHRRPLPTDRSTGRLAWLVGAHTWCWGGCSRLALNWWVGSLAVYPPFHSAVLALYGWAICAMEQTVLIPALSAVWVLDCRAVVAVRLTVYPPFHSAVLVLYGWAVEAVELTMLVPEPVSVGTLDSWAIVPVKLIVLVPEPVAVSIFYGRANGPVPLTALPPLLGPVGSFDSRPVLSVELLVKAPPLSAILCNK